MTEPADPYRKHQCFLGIVQTAWYRIHGQDHRRSCPLLRFKGPAKLLAHRRYLGNRICPRVRKNFIRG